MTTQHDTDANSGRAAMRALLDGLHAGARHPLQSVAAWAGFLESDGPSPLAVRFLTQLGTEWYPARVPDRLSLDVAQRVRDHIMVGGLAGGHLWAHVLRVTGVALALADAAGENPAHVYLAAICHDVAKLDENTTGVSHEQAGAAFAARVLDGTLPAGTIRAIQDAIHTESGGPLGDILHDADKLDKMGAAGVVRRCGQYVESGGLTAALDRVRDDAAKFPAMHFDASAVLAADKRVFLDWFMPLARAALDE